MTFTSSLPLRSWLYRIRPSVTQKHFEPFKYPASVQLDPPPLTSEFGASENVIATPEQLRFPPFALPEQGKPEMEYDFIEGLRTVSGTGSAMGKSGVSIHIYTFGRPMNKRAMYSADGDMLIGGWNRAKGDRGARNLRNERSQVSRGRDLELKTN